MLCYGMIYERIENMNNILWSHQQGRQSLDLVNYLDGEKVECILEDVFQYLM